jgi:hypothetical protein
MPKSEDERENVVEPVSHSEHQAVKFGVHLLQLLGAVLVAYVVLHFIIKYW